MALFRNFQIPYRVVLIRNLAKRALLASVRGHWKKKTEMQLGRNVTPRRVDKKGEKCDQTAFTREQLRKQWSIVSFREHDAQRSESNALPLSYAPLTRKKLPNLRVSYNLKIDIFFLQNNTLEQFWYQVKGL